MNKHIKALIRCRDDMERQYGVSYVYKLFLAPLIVAALGCDNDPIY